MFETEKIFTQTYIKYRNEHPATRELACYGAMYPSVLGEIQEHDLFAGRISYPYIGFSPEPGGFGYYIQKEELLKAAQENELDAEEMREVNNLIAFWENECTKTKVRAAYPQQTARALPSDNWTSESGVAFPLYRLAGGYLDYRKLLFTGISGIIYEIDNYESATGDVDTLYFYSALKNALRVFSGICYLYAGKANRMALLCKDEKRKKELTTITDNLEFIAVNPPKTFAQAIQLSWLYSLVSGVLNYGRMDYYLGDFYVHDIDKGIITEEQALAMLTSLWQLIADRKTVFNGRVIIGGKGRKNEKNADRFALLALQATQDVKEIEPQLTLRFYNGQNPLLWEKAMTIIGQGRTYPMLYNDDVLVPAVAKAFAIDKADAEHYMPFGCGEIVINHKSYGSPNGVINLLKVLEVTLHNGCDPVTGMPMGIKTGDIAGFTDFEQLFAAYQMQVEYYVEQLAIQEEIEYRIAGENAVFLFQSILYDDCIKRGKSLFAGGVRYLGGTLETYGNTNVADSLTAIRQLVYEKKECTLPQLVAMLDANFAGHENIRLKLLKAPKYGNDDAVADDMLVRVHEHVCNFTRQQKQKTALHSYLVVVINNWANTIFGRVTAASADGRRYGESLTNGNAPADGCDLNGATALLNSLVKPSPAIHAGAVQNLKFSREMFTDFRPQLEALLKAYFRQGGAQAMINVVNPGDLENAMREPEKYGHLFVRVGGFSARFVELPGQVQREIINRTLYTKDRV
ncbi:MAG TPA: pyruvate formate lyase family protein [bacterium]|nr:pyruvate formate lyase family protein [bacterium]HPN43858.1 pyruvate formate lyase family protein [bacterium]